MLVVRGRRLAWFEYKRQTSTLPARYHPHPPKHPNMASDGLNDLPTPPACTAGRTQKRFDETLG